MGKYDNVTMKEYMKKKKEMLDDLGRQSGACMGVKCSDCQLSSDRNDGEAGCVEMELTNPDKALEAIMEYEPKVDWSKAEVDTKILVRHCETSDWNKRHFAKYENGKIYTYPVGLSSFTYDVITDGRLVEWKYAKLYKGDE